MGKKSTNVETDPQVGKAALMQVELGKELSQLGRDEFNYHRARMDKMDPIYERLVNQSVQEAQTNQDRAKDQWQQYKDVFQPIENQVAKEAVNYDSADETSRREGLAAATVQRQFDASEQQMGRQMARMGVSPTSSLGTQGVIDQANARAMARAGAVNKERNDTKLLGMSLRQDAARFGRNQTGTGLAASAAALQGGQSASGLMGSQMQLGAMAGQQGSGIMNTGANQVGAGGDALLNQWKTKQETQAAMKQANSSGLGSAVGSAIGTIGMMYMSSEKLKENIRPTDDERALGELEQIAVADWKYKQGVADEGHHTGAIAEDVQAVMGDEVAPKGQAIDVISMSGKQHAAIRALSKRDKTLAQRLNRLEKHVGVNSFEDDQEEDKAESKESLPPALRGDLSNQVIGLASVL